MLQSQFSTLVITLTGCVIALAACTATEAPAEERSKAAPSDTLSQSCAINDRPCVQALVSGLAKSGDTEAVTKVERCIAALSATAEGCACQVARFIAAPANPSSVFARAGIEIACLGTGASCNMPSMPTECSEELLPHRPTGGTPGSKNGLERPAG